MKRKICEIILALVFLSLQCTLSKAISFNRIGPNFLILLPVFFGVLKGKNEGIFTGFVAGMFYDIFSTTMIGFTALIYIFVGYIAGCFYQKYEEKEMLIPVVLVFACNFSHEFLSYIGNFLLQNKLDMWFYLSHIVLPEAVYTTFVGLLLYRLFIPLNRLFEKKERKRVVETFD